ncbi:MAG: TetR family transcriptional regulator [Alphaproteobacteria bacterium]|nr:TetR family transcriptional regulator [Alphaproteobacteria bacterium]
MAQKKAPKKKSTARKAGPGPRERAIGAAMVLAETQGWSRVTLADIADEAGMSLAEIYVVFPSKAAILAGLSHHIDEIVLASDSGDLASESARDRLFDVLMRRLDALDAYKPALANVLRDCCTDPVSLACAGCGVRRSMAWMLEAAGLSSAGLRGRLRVKGLSVLWLLTLRTWFRDDSPDMAKTMAVLDRNLGRVDAAIGRCRRRRSDDEAATAATAT